MPQSEFERLLLKDSKTKIEFKPFGSETGIVLSLKIIRDYIAVPYKQGDRLVEPDDRECMRFLMLCRARLLNPFEGDAFMIPFFDKYQGKPVWSLITSHQAFLKRGEIHPDFDGKRSGIIINAQRCKPCSGDGFREGHVCSCCAGRGWYDELEGDFIPETIDGEPVELKGGWCRVYFKGRKNPEYQRLKLDTYRKNYGLWTVDPGGMICKCAEAASLRAAFPTLTGGMYLREEMLNESEPGQFAPPSFKDIKAAAPAIADKNPRKALFVPPDAPAAEGSPERNEYLPHEEERAEAEAGLAPAVAPANPVPAPPAPEDKPKQTLLVAVRNLCKLANIGEGRLLEFLNDIGLTDGSITSLEELAMSAPDTLVKVNADWQSIVKRLQPKKA